jgi:hypothetical protein
VAHGVHDLLLGRAPRGERADAVQSAAQSERVDQQRGEALRPASVNAAMRRSSSDGHRPIGRFDGGFGWSHVFRLIVLAPHRASFSSAHRHEKRDRRSEIGGNEFPSIAIGLRAGVAHSPVR